MAEKSTAASYGVSTAVGLLGLTFNEWIALGGFFFAAATFGINWYYKHKADRRAERELEAKLK